MTDSGNADPAVRISVHHDDHSSTQAPPGCTLSAFSSTYQVLWGTGAALVIDLPAPWPEHVDAVTDALRSIDATRIESASDVRDPGAIALGALPYDRHAGATFVVPEVLHVQRAEGSRLRITVEATVADPGATVPATSGPETSDLGDEGPAGLASLTAPSQITVRSVHPTAQWCAAVRAARDRIRAGELDKVVLAREIELSADAPLDAATLWNRLCHTYPGAFCFAVDGFVGASPELLVSRIGSTVRAQPMAGTTTRTGHPEQDQRGAGELLGSEKNRREHQITIDAVHDGLLGWCSYLDAEPTPSVVQAGPVQHLATMVEGRLSRPEPSVLELVAALHPTPAVGGWPTGAAVRLQSELTPGDRGRYAGPVGWVDAAGNGEFAVGIRSVQLHGRCGRLFAGVGVVADSDPEAELAETRAKAQALLGAIVQV